MLPSPIETDGVIELPAAANAIGVDLQCTKAHPHKKGMAYAMASYNIHVYKHQRQWHGNNSVNTTYSA